MAPSEHSRATLYKIAGIKGDDAADEAKLRKLPQMNMKALLRAVAKASGMPNADYCSDMELASWGSGLIDLRTFGRRDAGAANKIVGNFSNLLANVATKQVQQGLDSYNAATWHIWCTQRNVPNFLQVTNTNLSAGLLTETAEDVAFPELTQKDGGYNSTLGIFGGTISVTFQAIINDQLGKIMADLRRMGMIAAQTIDYTAYSKLLNATWTNDVSATSPLSTIAIVAS